MTTATTTVPSAIAPIEPFDPAGVVAGAPAGARTCPDGAGAPGGFDALLTPLPPLTAQSLGTGPDGAGWGP
jgi:hypothetical protein